MRRVFINKWFILASLLTLSFSAFSFITFRNADVACPAYEGCDKTPAGGSEKTDLLWDLLGPHMPTASFH